MMSAASAQHQRTRHITIVACEACRKRRSKCDGRRPLCSACEIRATSCEYVSANNSETHSQLLKRKQSELRTQVETYDEVFRVLRSRTRSEAIRVLDQIRAGSSIDAILSQVKDIDLRAQVRLAPDITPRHVFPLMETFPVELLDGSRNPYLDSVVFREAMGTRSSENLHPAFLAPYQAVKLIEPLLPAVGAEPWTSITDDDDLVRTLLEIYFLQEYPFLPFFHKDHFLSDMSSGKTSFCSSLLVNSILACAAHGYSGLPSRADFWSPKTLAYQFESEARRLWDIEHERPSLTTIQAAVILCITANINGSDRIGWRYLEAAVTMAQRLDLFSKTYDGNDRRVLASEMMTSWSLFAWQATTCFHLHRPPLLASAPECDLPPSTEMHDFSGEIWIHYPTAPLPIPLQFGRTLRALLEFRSIVHDIAKHAFRSESDKASLSPVQVLQFRARLVEWYERLTGPFSPGRIVFPSHLKMHAHYHNVTVALFKPFAEQMVNKIPSGPGWKGTLELPHSIFATAKICMEMVVRLYYLRHGFELWDSMMPQFLATVGFAAAEDLAIARANRETDNRQKAALSTLILCIKGLFQQGKSEYVAEVIYRLLRGTMAAADIGLLRDEARIDDEEDRSALMLRHVHSSWPLQNANITKDSREHEIDSLVRSASQLDVEGS